MENEEHCVGKWENWELEKRKMETTSVVILQTEIRIIPEVLHMSTVLARMYVYR
jgi:hypothetical protein